MRLIDADELIEMIEGSEELLDFQKDECIQCVNACDTAHDVEKVVAELEEKQIQAEKDMQLTDNSLEANGWGGMMLAYGLAIPIVRNGGKE